MASRKPPGRSPPPEPEFNDEDKTPITIIPPATAKKLKLPLPGDLVEKTPERPAAPSLPVAPPPSVKKSTPKKLKLFRVRPAERGPARVMLFVVGALLAMIMVAFAVAPDGKSPEEIARSRNEGHRAGESLQRPINSYKDRIQIENPDLIVRSPVPSGEMPPQERLPDNPTPLRERHAGKKDPIPLNVEDRYGYERVDQPKRNYDNFDASQDQGSGIPMLMAFSKPRGMNVEVNGQLLGMTPLIRTLPKDTKRVKVRLSGAGFREWEQTVAPNQLDQFKVGVTMERIAE